MPNLTALVGLLVGLIALFVDAAVGVKLIAVYLLLAGGLRLISTDNAEALPRAPRRAAVATPTEEEDLDDPDEPAAISSPADAYRTFTPEELAPQRSAAKPRRKPAAKELSDEEDEE
jgi:hypothetical protein